MSKKPIKIVSWEVHFMPNGGARLIGINEFGHHMVFRYKDDIGDQKDFDLTIFTRKDNPLDAAKKYK